MALPSALQIPYRESREGFWGEQTSTLNWCEEVIARPVLEPISLSLSLSLSLRKPPNLQPPPGLQHHLLLRRGRQHLHKPGVYVARIQGPSECLCLLSLEGLYPRLPGVHGHRARVDGVPHHAQVSVLPASRSACLLVLVSCFCLFPPNLCVFLLSYPPSLIADEMQLADELPMIYTGCIMAFAAFSYRRSARMQALIAAALAGLAVFITVCASISDTVS